MPRRYVELSTSFSTADTMSPVDVSARGQSLCVTFTDHQGVLRSVCFDGVSAFSWRDSFAGDENPPCPDRVYRVEGSEWLLAYTLTSAHQHLILGFNAVGHSLEVIASSIREESPNHASQPTAATGRG